MMDEMALMYRLRRLTHYFQGKRAAKVVTAFLFFAVVGLVMAGLYAGFLRGFRFIARDPFFGEAVLWYAIEMFLLIVSFLIFFSAGISALFTYFRRGREDVWIMATPSFGRLFEYHYLRVVISASWPLIVVAFPALAALWVAFPISLWLFVGAFVAVLILVFFIITLTIALLFVVALLVRARASQKNFFRSVVILFTLVAVVLAGSVWGYIKISQRDLADLFQASNLAVATAGTDRIAHAFRFFPSHPAAQTITSAIAGDLAGVFGGLLFLSVALALAASFVFYLSRFYLVLWQGFQEGRFQARARLRRRPRSFMPLGRFTSFSQSVLGAVFEKEAIIMTRSIRNLLWAGFLVALWFIQTSVNLFLRAPVRSYTVTISSIPAIIQAVQLATVVFFVTALVIRFAFPAFSSELKTAWILGSAPVPRRALFFAKFLFYGGLFAALGLFIGMMNAAVLPLQFTVPFLVFVAIAVFFVTALGLSFGTIYPNFETDDPQVLSTTLPGLFVMFAALAYGGGGAWLLYTTFLRGAPFWFYFFELASVTGGGLLLWFGARAAERIEFVPSRG